MAMQCGVVRKSSLGMSEIECIICSDLSEKYVLIR
jgi:hypothetical protein